MNFSFSEEQEEFRSMLRRFLDEKSPTAEVFRLMDTAEGCDAAVWKQMAEELGLQGIHIPETYGGQGFGFLELCIALEEMGRVLLCAPFFSTVCLAANAIMNAGSDADKRALLPGIASGATIATLAVIEKDDTWDANGVRMVFERAGDDYVLEGSKALVTDGALADVILVAARRPGTAGDEGVALFAVRGGTEGLHVTPVDPLDATRKLADIEFAGVKAELLGEEGASGPALRKTLDQACVCLAAESAGGAQRCLDASVAYANARVQFARPIGSFQAIKHKCAEVLLEVESAKATAYYAAWAAENDEELSLAASMAKSCCDDALERAAAENIQIHGGIGFTWEADPHLYFKRAKATATLLGNPFYHRARIAEQKGF
jgi:alkylation response protein AidB-like acyl-CoA dehydrogenase